jgi:integrase
MKSMLFTRQSVAEIPLGAPGLIADAAFPALKLRAGRKRRSYVLVHRVRGAPTKTTIGDAARISPSAAREIAKKLLGQSAAGLDLRRPVRRKISLEDAWADFLRDRRLRPATVRTYRTALYRSLSQFLHKDITAISPEEVRKLHRELSDRSPQYANGVMRVLRSVLNFARNEYRSPSGVRLLTENPVERLSETRAWNAPTRRKTVIPLPDLPRWLDALPRLNNPVAEDYFLFLLLTGLRREEAAQLRWDSVDFRGGTFTIPASRAKNHQDHTLPMTPRVAELIKRRDAARVNEYVFPGERGHLVNSRRQRDNLVQLSGIVFTPHDLRRTFATAAQELNLSAYTIKRLLNHKTGADVTEGRRPRTQSTWPKRPLQ